MLWANHVFCCAESEEELVQTAEFWQHWSVSLKANMTYTFNAPCAKQTAS